MKEEMKAQQSPSVDRGGMMNEWWGWTLWVMMSTMNWRAVRTRENEQLRGVPSIKQVKAKKGHSC